MVALRKQQGPVARCLEFLVLTAARTDEARRTTPTEIDHANKVWVVPPSRMKARKEHRVPLSERAAEIAGQAGAGYLFPGVRANTVDAMSMRRLLEKMGYGSKTSVHGFRSCFKDWARERTSFSDEISEMALAHGDPNKVRAAYARSDLFDRRRELMESWSQFCSQPPAKVAGKVVPLRSAS